MRLPKLALGGFLACCALGAAPASAIIIEYQLQTFGGGNHGYVYTVVNDGSLPGAAAVRLFDILFDPALYRESSLASASPSSLTVHWEETFYPATFDDPAFYDAAAIGSGIAAGHSLHGFSVSFEWLGSPALPGEQPFEVFDPITFELLEVGVTRRALTPIQMSVPGALGLIVPGVLGLVHCRRRR